MPVSIDAAVEGARVPMVPGPLSASRGNEMDDGTLPAPIAGVRPGTVEVAIPVRPHAIRFLACSLVLHLAVLLALLVRNEQVTPGAEGHELDAVGVEVVSVAVLESLQRQAAPQSGGVAAPIDQHEGEPAPPPPPVTTAAPEAPPPEPEQSKALEQPDPDPPVEDVPVIAAAPTVAPVPKVAPEQNDEPPPKEEKQKAEPQPAAAAPPAPPASTAQAAAQARDAGNEGPSAASASPGEVARFAMAVRQALGRARPRHPGVRGRVEVRFSLADTGAVLSAEVLRSSGNGRADEAALNSIRMASFPRPPAGMSATQLVYVVPFDFR